MAAKSLNFAGMRMQLAADIAEAVGSRKSRPPDDSRTPEDLEQSLRRARAQKDRGIASDTPRWREIRRNNSY